MPCASGAARGPSMPFLRRTRPWPGRFRARNSTRYLITRASPKGLAPLSSGPLRDSMTEWQDEAIVLSARPHGETGAVASLLTRGRGRAMGYVYGAASGRVRAVLEVGNLVLARWQAKAEGQLGNF